MKNIDFWGSNIGQYSLTHRQIKGEKCYQINYFEKPFMGVVVGFVKTKKEAVEFIMNHKKQAK